MCDRYAKYMLAGLASVPTWVRSRACARKLGQVNSGAYAIGLTVTKQFGTDASWECNRTGHASRTPWFIHLRAQRPKRGRWAPTPIPSGRGTIYRTFNLPVLDGQTDNTSQLRMKKIQIKFPWVSGGLSCDLSRIGERLAERVSCWLLASCQTIKMTVEPIHHVGLSVDLHDWRPSRSHCSLHV